MLDVVGMVDVVRLWIWSVEISLACDSDGTEAGRK